VEHNLEVQRGERFEFGENWKRFLETLTETRILEAEASLRDMLEVSDLKGKSFLDVGCGSGLFSLVARRMGARVVSFDYDPQSVECTRALKDRFFQKDSDWRIEHGSVLDNSYLAALGQFDIVYSWGVLHHSGNMWQALENVSPLVADEGKLFIALYNDQGRASRFWKTYKQLYNRSHHLVRLALAVLVAIRFWTLTTIPETLKGHPFRSWRNYHQNSRGMSAWHDIVDWAGGYPFEVAKPEQVFEFYKQRGFALVKLITRAGIGNNEFVLQRKS
jgi:2-polyprenyl-3-methyl-5-hydroxy-6-metoxy-1,4-benzoquinol methylase